MLEKYYDGTPEIISLSTEIGRLIGIVDANHLQKPRTELRRKNKIQTIHSSLAIEGNTLSEEQVSDILENKKVVGPPKDIMEVRNAIKVYENISKFDAMSEKSYLQAHKMLMEGLVEDAGKYRTKGVGIFKGDEVAHMAPPAWNVSNLMSNLFEYLKNGNDNLIIKSCVFHYEMEFIHPFMDGNGRMGRLWQTVILMLYNMVFEFLPIEQQIKNNQQEYYDVLAVADKQGLSTKFIEYMLKQIKNSLETLINSQRISFSDIDRINYYIELNEGIEFSRKDYMDVFKEISSSTASRDLKKGVDEGWFVKIGSDRMTRYKVKNK